MSDVPANTYCYYCGTAVQLDTCEFTYLTRYTYDRVSRITRASLAGPVATHVGACTQFMRRRDRTLTT